jgi:hypothetical protein
MAKRWVAGWVVTGALFLAASAVALTRTGNTSAVPFLPAWLPEPTIAAGFLAASGLFWLSARRFGKVAAATGFERMEQVRRGGFTLVAAAAMVALATTLRALAGWPF